MTAVGLILFVAALALMTWCVSDEGEITPFAFLIIQTLYWGGLGAMTTGFAIHFWDVLP